jgi:hypothetical protein
MIKPAERLRRVLPWVAFVGSLLALFGESLLQHMQLSAEPGVTNDDALQQIYPFFRYEDSQLFPRNYITDYYLACMPWGFRALYMIAGHFGVATEVSKVVPYVGLLITVVGMAWIAKRFGGSLGAWVVAALCLGSSLYLARMTGGLPRAFAFPFLTLAGLALTYGRVRALAWLVPLAAAFYPAAAVPIGISLALTLIVLPAGSRGDAETWTFKQRATLVMVAGVAAALVLLPSALASNGFGKVIRPGDVVEFPEAGPGGRYGGDDRAPFPGFFEATPKTVQEAVLGAGEPLFAAGRQWLDKDDHRTWLLGVLSLLALGGWVCLVFKVPAARRFATLALAALLAHTIAVPIVPFFYLPQRYLVYPLPILATVMLATGAAGYLLLSSRLSRAKHAVTVAIAVTALPLLLGFGGHGSPHFGLKNDTRKATALFAALERLPKDALIAGWPDGTIDNVPYFARRQVLLSYETHQAFHVDYVLEMRRRMNAVIAAYFATSTQPIIALRREFGVTHLLVDMHHFLQATPCYFNPFGPTINAAAKAGHGNYEVMRLAARGLWLDRGRYVLIDLESLEAPPNLR